MYFVWLFFSEVMQYSGVSVMATVALQEAVMVIELIPLSKFFHIVSFYYRLLEAALLFSFSYASDTAARILSHTREDLGRLGV